MLKRLVYNIFIFLIVSVKAQTLTITSISPTVICGNGSTDTFSYKVAGNNIAAGANIQIYESTNTTFNPYVGQGNLIASVKADSIKQNNSCIKILGLFIDACATGGNEGRNEYMTVASGAGIKVSNFAIDFSITNNNFSNLNHDINFDASPCSFKVAPENSLITNLRANAPCSNANIIPVGANDSIPANVIILIFTSDNVGATYNMSALCAKGFPIYVLQNDCQRTIGAFSNVNDTPNECATPADRYRHYVVRNIATGCYDSLVYDRCHNPSGFSDGTYVVNLPGIDTLSIANGGIKNNAVPNNCVGISFTSDGLNYQEIVKNTDTTFRFVIPPAFCNTGFHYIKAITNPGTPQVTSNTIQYKLVCLDLIATPVSTSICSGQNAVINNSSNDPNASFSWTISGGTNITGASNGNGIQINQTLINSSSIKDSILYSITSSDDGCTANKIIKIIVNPFEPKPNIGRDTSFCGSFNHPLITNNTNTVWFKDNVQINTGVGNINVNQIGTYIAVVSGTCGSASDTIIITQSSNQPKPNIGRDTSFCGSFNHPLITNNTNTVWFKDNVQINTGVGNINVNQIGTYIAVVSGTCGSASDTIIITQSSNQPKPNIGRDTSFCGSFNHPLITNNTNTVWFKDNVQINTGVGNINVNQIGTYIAVVSGTCGSASDTIIITQSSNQPKPNIGRDTSFCGAFTKRLSTGNVNTVWTRNNVAFATDSAVTINQPGVYISSISSSCGNATDTINITQSTGINFSFGGNTSICSGSTASIDASSNYDKYLWNTGDTTHAIIVSMPGKYWVTVTKNGCSGTDTILVIQNNKPANFSLGTDTTFCDTIIKTLIAPSNNAVWNNNIGLPSTTSNQLSISKPGKYWATITNSCGSAKDTIELFLNKSPNAFSLGRDTGICDINSNTKTLSTGNVTTVWTRDGLPLTTAASISVNQYGKYIATITNSCGSKSDTITISNGNNLLVKIGDDTIRKCTGSTILLDAGSGFSTYIWNTSEVTRKISVLNSGQYIVTVTKNGCIGIDTILIEDVSLPIINNIGNDTTYCGSFSRILSTNNITTKWNTNETGNQINVTQPNIYIATISNACGSVSDTIKINQSPLPIILISALPEFCDSAELSIKTSNINKIRWNTFDTTSSITVFNEGIYSVSVMDTNNCKSTDSVFIKKLCDYTVYLPTAFSPNNDGIHDILIPLSNRNDIQILKFQIYNRWGEKIFESNNFKPNDKNFGWNGFFKNAECQQDNYIYIIEASSPQNNSTLYKGIFTLLK